MKLYLRQNTNIIRQNTNINWYEKIIRDIAYNINWYKKIIKDVDSNAFTTISSVAEVKWSNFYNLENKYLPFI